MFSNGNSFSGGQNMNPKGSREPWYIRVLLASVQDRGSI